MNTIESLYRRLYIDKLHVNKGRLYTYECAPRGKGKSYLFVRDVKHIFHFVPAL